MEPRVAALGPFDRIAAATGHDAVTHSGSAGQGRVGVVLQVHVLPGAERVVLRHQHRGPEVFHAVPEGLGRESAEDDRVRRAQPGAGQHGNGQFGDHPHVDRHAPPAPDAECPQRVREAADALVQFAVGDVQPVAGLALPVERDAVAALGQVPVQAVGGHVQGAAGEPAVEWGVGFVERGVPGGVPLQAPRLVLPPAHRVGSSAVIDGGVADDRVGRHPRRRRVGLSPLLKRVDRGPGVAHWEPPS